MKSLQHLLVALALTAVLGGCTNPPSSNSTPTPQVSTTHASLETPSVTATPTASQASSGSTFEKSLELQDHTFVITSTGSEITVTTSGAEIVSEPQVETYDGNVVEAEVADLDANGFPEIYIYVTNNDEQKTGKLIAYASNQGKSVTPINLPPIDSVEGAAEGYRGGDEMRVVENRLVQRFSVYKEGDAEGQPSAGTRQIQWKLEPGEATWTLVSDKVENY